MAAKAHGEHHWRVIIVSALASVAIVLTAVTSIVNQVRSVTIVDQGVVRSVTTVAGNVEEVLRAQGIAVGEHDRVSPRLDSAIADGGAISIIRSAPVEVVSGEYRWTEWVSGHTISQRLESLPKVDSGRRGADAAAGDGVFIVTKRGEYMPLSDQPTPLKIMHDATTTEIMVGSFDDVTKAVKRSGLALSPTDILAIGRDQSGAIIARVQRVVEEIVTRTEEIAFSKQQIEDPKVPKGQSIVKIKGITGERTVTEKVDKVDGKIVNIIPISSQITKKPVDEVVSVGSGDPRFVKNIAVSAPTAPANPTGAQAIARDMLAAHSWDDSQFGCLVSLWNRESGWNVHSQNRSSGAYGIPQALPGSKMASAGADWRTNPATQIRWGLGYIARRYGSPCGAWAHFRSHNWY